MTGEAAQMINPGQRQFARCQRRRMPAKANLLIMNGIGGHLDITARQDATTIEDVIHFAGGLYDWAKGCLPNRDY